MYSLTLSPEQLEIRDTVRDFVERQLKPRALAPARLEAREQPLLIDVLEQASRLGLRTLALSEDGGGAGADQLTCCIVTEELAAGDPDVAAVLARTATLARELFDAAMTPQQRERFLPAFLSDERYHLALAEHEPDGDDGLGIHYHRPRPLASGLKTTAQRAGDVWIINGFKDCVANAPIAKLLVVEVASGTGGASTLLVPRDAPGLDITASAPDTRWCHGACGEARFADCRVPVENLLGVEGQSPLRDGDRRLILDAALNLGVGRAAFEAALDYAQLRVQGGRRIIEHQAIGEKLAGIAIRLEVARAAIRQAAWACDHPEAVADGSLADLPLAGMARTFASEAICSAAKDAAECFGAMGVMRDLPMQKFVRDALICLHSGAGNSDARLRIAEALAGYRPPSPPAALAAE